MREIWRQLSQEWQDIRSRPQERLYASLTLTFLSNSLGIALGVANGTLDPSDPYYYLLGTTMAGLALSSVLTYVNVSKDKQSFIEEPLVPEWAEERLINESPAYRFLHPISDYRAYPPLSEIPSIRQN